MRIDLSSEANPGMLLVAVEVDPSRVRGSRSSFGPLLHVGVQILPESRHKPLLFEGTIRWTGEQIGIPIPMQSIGLGTAELTIPLSDHQVASVERTRASREPIIDLDLCAVGTPNGDGQLGRYRSSFAPSLSVPRDRWKAALDGFGTSTVRIIELPSRTAGTDESWRRAFELLDKASRLLSEARYGEAVTTSRSALERITESVGSQVGYRREGINFSNYVDELAKLLKGRRNGADPFALIGQLIRTAFSWSSHPVHQGFDVSERDDAIFAVNLCVALYSYLVRAGISVEQSAADDS